MNALRPFSFDDRPVRVIDQDGQLWFVAADVCAVLGIQNPTQATARLDADERSMLSIGRQGDTTVINEGGLYTVILRCRDAMKPGTAPYRFRKWVTAELIPAIRRNGRYVPADLTAALEDPEAMRQLLLGAVDRLIEARTDNAQLSQKASALDRLADTAGDLCVSDAAKVLGMPPKKLFHRLAADSWIFRRGENGPWAAYQARLSAGLLRQRVTRLTRTDGTARVVEQVTITPRGLAKLATDLGVQVTQ